MDQDDEWRFILKMKDKVARRSSVVKNNTMLASVEEKVRGSFRKSISAMTAKSQLKPLKAKVERE